VGEPGLGSRPRVVPRTGPVNPRKGNPRPPASSPARSQKKKEKKRGKREGGLHVEIFGGSSTCLFLCTQKKFKRKKIGRVSFTCTYFERGRFVWSFFGCMDENLLFSFCALNMFINIYIYIKKFICGGLVPKKKFVCGGFI
jgi:hypothetical protein